MNYEYVGKERYWLKIKWWIRDHSLLITILALVAIYLILMWTSMKELRQWCEVPMAYVPFKHFLTALFWMAFMPIICFRK
jgi:polyferredoxin